MKPLSIYRPGPHFPALDATALEKTVSAYNPALHEAPLVIGHPAHDAPAYGWVASLAFAEGLLKAAPRQVAAELGERVDGGRFKKISAAFYRPDVPQNPVPGVYYLRHVGFLGAQPPEVKGLPAVEFADSADDWVSVEFGERDPWMFRLLSRLFRSQREYLISQADLETADRVLPDFDIQALADEAERQMQEQRAEPEPQFSEDDVTQPGNPGPTPKAAELAQRQADLDAREASLNTRESTLTKTEADASRRETAAFCEELVTQGRLLPRDKDAMVEFMETLPAEATVTFAESGAAVARPGKAPEFIRDFLKRLPVQVDFSERTPGTGEEDPPAPIRLPRGVQSSPETEELHRRTVAFAEKHNVSYDEALTRITTVGG